MTIGERIKSLRERKKLTQTELAEIVGTSKQNIYKYENNIITNIPSDKIEIIAGCFNVSPSYLMGWEQSIDGLDSTDSKIAKEDPSLDETESEILILARKTKDLPESDRKKLVKIFESSINTFLEAQNKDD